jgi:hypothetical protein
MKLKLFSSLGFTLYILFISSLLLLPCSWASGETSSNHQPYSRVGLLNNTPNFHIELTIDGVGPFTLHPRQTESLPLKVDNTIGEHRLLAKAYVCTRHLGWHQIGKECAIIFEITGEVKNSPVGKVGWYKIFTFRDFLPQSASFPARGFEKITPKPPVISKKPVAKYYRRWKKDSICGLIHRASEKYRVPVTLLTAIIEVESGFNPQAISRKGALGLMQLMPETCKRFSVQRPFDPRQNVEGGAKYLSHLLYQWSLRFPSYQRLELSLAAYNAGEEKVEVYGGIPPFKETKNYVREVLRRCKYLENDLGYGKPFTCSP